jgi:hypothetical protein
MHLGSAVALGLLVVVGTSAGCSGDDDSSTSAGGSAGQPASSGGSAGSGGALNLGGTSNLGLAGEGGVGEGGASFAGVKEPLSGLIDMQNISWHNGDTGVPSFKIADLTPFPGQFGGIVINAAWNQLAPTADGPLDFSSIDAALADVRAYNANNPTAPIGVKLRVYAGDTAPDWAKAIDGGPVTIYRNQAGCSTYPTPCPITVGKYWTAEFIAAWRSLQASLAARYDDEPLIRQVAVTSCAPQTDEPFVPSAETDAKSNLSDAGYTDEAEKACLSGAIDDYAGWTRTLIDYTFNPFYKIGGGTDTDFTISVMEACRSAVGARCVLDNHALGWPLADTDPLKPVYDELQSLGGPINFQTQAPKGMQCQWTATVALGVSVGARAIEIWPQAMFDGFDSLTTDNIATLVSEFTTPVPVPTGDPVGACPNFN